MEIQNKAIFPIPSPKCGGIYSGGEVCQASCKEKTQSLQIITSTTTSRAVEAQREDRQEGAIKQCVCYSYYLPLLTSLLLSSR